MTIQATVRLNTIHCIAERDGPYSSGSEPYIWGFLGGIGSNPLSLDSVPDFPILAESRKILKNDMKAGQTAAMDFPGNLFVQNFKDGQTSCQLIFIVALLEADEMTTSAMQDGYQAFVDELYHQIPHIIALAGLSDADQQEGMKPIIKAVQDKVFAGIESGLSTTEKISIKLGFTDEDDFVAAAFRLFENIETRTTAEPFTLRLSGTPVVLRLSSSFGGATNIAFPREFELAGELTVTGVPRDRCQDQIDAVKEAQARLSLLQKEVIELREKLKTVVPTEKAALLEMLEKKIAEAVPAARQRLTLAQMALRRCRIFGGVEPVVEQPNMHPVG